MKILHMAGLIAVGSALVATGPVSAQVRQRAIHGAVEATYKKFIKQIEKDGLRPVWIHVLGGAERPLFTAVALDDGVPAPWVERHHLSGEAWQRELEAWTATGYRLICQSGYANGAVTNFAGLFVKDASAPRWEVRRGQTSAEYQAAFDSLSKKSFRPAQINGYPAGKDYRLASIFIDDKVNDCVAFHDQNDAEYQEGFDDFVPKGYRPVAIAAYPTGAGTRFASAFVRGGQNVAWLARHNLPSKRYQKEVDRWTAKGYVPMQVVSYSEGKGPRYAVLFQKPTRPVQAVHNPLPVSGREAPALAAFDEAMQKFMKDRHILGGTLAVMKNNEVLLAHGYGYSDAAATKKMGPDQPFRLASISKPITLAGLIRLIMQGKLNRDTKVVDFLGITPPAGKTMDERWKDITVQHLINHKGGFNRDKSGDPMFMSTRIATALGKPGPASPRDIITYMAGKPLDFTPGSKSVYSNFGYCILGRVIEKASGKTYMDYMKSEFFTPMNLKTIDLGRSLPADRNPAEPVYLDPHDGRNVITGKGRVPAPDGSFYLEALDAHGGLISSAPDLARFFSAFWMDGSPRKGGSRSSCFFGSLPGTWTCAIQRRDGYVIVALFNQSEDESGLDYDAISDLLNQAADSIE